VNAHEVKPVRLIQSLGAVCDGSNSAGMNHEPLSSTTGRSKVVNAIENTCMLKSTPIPLFSGICFQLFLFDCLKFFFNWHFIIFPYFTNVLASRHV